MIIYNVAEMLKAVNFLSVLSADAGNIIFSRCMAFSKYIYVKEGSSIQDSPKETKKLIDIARNPDGYS